MTNFNINDRVLYIGPPSILTNRTGLIKAVGTVSAKVLWDADQPQGLQALEAPAKFDNIRVLDHLTYSLILAKKVPGIEVVYHDDGDPILATVKFKEGVNVEV